MADRAWERTPAWWRALAASLAGCLLAVVLRRPELVILTAPFTLAAAVDWQPPAGRPWLTTRAAPVVREGEPIRARWSLTGIPPSAVVATTAVTTDGSVTKLTTGSPAHEIDHDDASPRWGRHAVSPVHAHAVSGWAGWAAGVAAPPALVTVLPLRRLPALGALPRPTDLGPGPHPGSRTGPGTDFAGLRPIGDHEPARRVHWPTTLRTGHLTVTETHHDTSGAYLVLLDAGNDPDTHDDVVRSAAGLSTALVRDGAHVALAVHGCGDLPPVGLGTGSRHLTRIELALARAVPRPGDPVNDHQHRRTLRLRLPPGTVVVAFAPLLVGDVVTTLLRMTGARRRVTVIDTATDLVTALDQLEQRVHQLLLESHGIPVTPWTTPTAAVPTALRRLRGRVPV